MIANLNDKLAELEKDAAYKNASSDAEKFEIITKNLEPENAKVFNSLPAMIKAQLLMDRDPHGNVQVSRIDTEKLLIAMVREQLN